MPNLNIDITARFAQFQDSLDKVNRNVTGFSNRLNSAFTGIATALGGLGLTASVAGFGALAKAAINAADEAGKSAQKFGLTAESLTELQYSAQLADVSNETLGQSLKKLSVGMFEAQSNTGEAKEAFKALGISVSNSSGQLKQSDKVLFEIADKFENMKDGAGKTALAVQLFGRAGAELIPLLNGGAAALQKNTEEARKFGVVISSDAAVAAEKFNDNITRLSSAARGAGFALGNEMLPTLNKIVERMVEATKIGGSLLGTLSLLAQQTSVFSKPAENLKELNRQLDILQNRKGDPSILDRIMSPFRGTGKSQDSTAEAIERIQKQIALEKSLQQQQALSLPGGDTPGERARMAREKSDAPRGVDKEAAARAKSEREKAAAEALALERRFQAELLSIQDQARKTEGAVGPFFDMQAKLRTESFKNLSEQRKQELLDGAALQQQREDLARQNKELDEGLTRNATEQAEANTKALVSTNALREAYLDMGDPLRSINRQIAEVNNLIKDSPEDVEGLTNAWIVLQQKIVDASQPMKDFKDDLKNTNDIARDLGLTFTSAFEEAIIGGKKFKDVLGGILQDIAKLLTRKAVTEPLLKAVDGIDWKSIIAGMGFGGGGGASTQAIFGGAYSGRFATGTDYVPRTGWAMVHEGERIIPAKSAGGGGVTVINNNDFRGVDPMAMARMEGKLSRLEQTTAARVKDAQRRSV